MSAELKAASEQALTDLESVSQVYPETLSPIRAYINALESKPSPTAKKAKKAKK